MSKPTSFAIESQCNHLRVQEGNGVTADCHHDPVHELTTDGLFIKPRKPCGVHKTCGKFVPVSNINNS